MQLIQASLDTKSETISITLRDNYGQPRIVELPILSMVPRIVINVQPEHEDLDAAFVVLGPVVPEQKAIDEFASAVVAAIDRFAVRSPSESI